MLDLAAASDAGTVRPSYAGLSRRCALRATRRSASSTTSASRRRAPRPRPQRDAGVELVVLYVAYARGGIDRFRQESVAEYLRELEQLRDAGVASASPPSVRACPRGLARRARRYARGEGLPLHVHADEQPREIEECLAEHGVRPIELLADPVASAPARRSCTRRTPTAELDLLGRGGGARLRVPDDRGEPRRRLPSGRAGAAPRDRDLHRLRLERPHRPVRGAARARRDRPPPVGAPRRAHRRRAARDRLRRGRGALGLEELAAIEIDVVPPAAARGRRSACALVAGCSADVVRVRRAR